MPKTVTTSILILVSALGSAAPEDGPIVVLERLDGAAVEGRVVRWTAAEGVRLRLAGGENIDVELSSIDRLRAKLPSVKTARGEWVVQIGQESRLTVSIIGGGTDAVRVLHEIIGELEIPFERIARITRRDSDTGESRRPPSKDQALLRNGDLLSGSVSSMDAGGVSVLSADGRTEDRAEWPAIVAVRFAETTRASEPNGWLAAFDNGDVLTVDTIEWNAVRVRLISIGGATHECSADRIASIEARGGGRVWLSTIEPASYESIPFFSRAWPLQRDRNALGDRLRFGGRTFDRGLGLHSACRVTWTLDGRYDRLTGLVGIDDSAGDLADADFLILAGRVTLFEARGLRRGEAPRTVAVDVSDLREITIEVGFGRGGDVQDRVNFANAALRR